MTTTNETVPTEQKFYNPLIVKLESLEIQDKKVENYLTQIKNNFYCSVKAHYLIARDLFDAKTNLKTPDFARLVEQLGFSGSTQAKYIKVGSDVRLWKLFIEGKLPMKWTNQYLLTCLTDEQFKKVEKIIDAETSAKKISEVANLTKAEKNQVVNQLLTFLQIEIDKSEIESVSTFEKIVEKVKSALSKIPQIKIDDERVETVKERLTTYITKLQKEKERKEARKLKEMKDSDNKKLSQTLLNKSKTIGVIA